MTHVRIHRLWTRMSWNTSLTKSWIYPAPIMECDSSPSCAMPSGRGILNAWQHISKSTTSYTEKIMKVKVLTCHGNKSDEDMNEIATINTGVEVDDIRPLICELRGQAVMLDRDLASLYHVMTGRLNEAVKRNIARFPAEFMFQLSDSEMKELIANCDRFKMMKHSPPRWVPRSSLGFSNQSAKRQRRAVNIPREAGAPMRPNVSRHHMCRW